MATDWSVPHPNKCHFWAGGLSDLCGEPTMYSVYYFGDRRHSDFIANVCEKHAESTVAEKIDCVIRNRWTNALYAPNEQPCTEQTK